MIINDLIIKMNHIAETLIRVFPDWTTGKSDVMSLKYYKKHGSRDYSQMIKRNKIRTMTFYMGITAIFLIMLLFGFLGRASEGKEISTILRPTHDQTASMTPVTAHINYKGIEFIKNFNLHIEPKALDDSEKLTQLQDFISGLEEMILGENEDLNHICKPLRLIQRDEKTGITIDWSSSNPELISEDGEVNILGGSKSKTIELTADLMLDDITITARYDLKIEASATKQDYERSLAFLLGNKIDDILNEKKSETITLPAVLNESVMIRWFSGRKDDTTILLLAFFLMILITYFKRYDHIDREIKAAENSLIRDLPEFLNKMVLLLNAGLVVSTAFSKIVGDYEKFCNTGAKQKEKKYLYEEMLEIKKRASQSNTSLIKELKDFSQRCGVREMVRLTAVISDNWNKGSTLAEKLEAESSLMWISRKKRAEEKGKLAETKLTFPLVILLLVLIMISIAPAMLAM